MKVEMNNKMMRNNNMSEEAAVKTDSFADLVQHALDKDYNNANKVFGNLMQAKIGNALDQEKIRLADQIYNGVEADAENDENDEDIVGDEDGDDQLDLDFEAEGESEEEETEE